MEARLIRICLLLGALSSLGASYETQNFTVSAPTPEIAQQVGDAAEHYRRELSVEWLGRELPKWHARCPIRVKVGQMGAGGSTTFTFDRGQVFGWDMRIQGSLERILDSVLPHEVSHTIFACHFRRPLPRWADEGAASLIEHESERYRLRKMAEQVLTTRERIPLQRLLTMKDYPTDMQHVLTLYAQGYSLADYLIQRGGKHRYLKLLEQSHKDGWDTALRQHYGYRGIDALEETWSKWVLAGSPQLATPEGTQVASTAAPTPAQEVPVVRGQSPDAQSAARPEAAMVAARDVSMTLPVTTQSPVVGNSDSDSSPGEQQARHDGWSPASRKPRPATWHAPKIVRESAE